ncbi:MULTISPECIES: hypothetical protein [unclassified Ruegeria]|uniref:hypothetical protein n=2 Tax=Ruegeria TaxID=97050 RepID=UPI00148947E6|nr:MULTISPECIES: hypothetical protein [unclassified Ruegeria]
MYTNKMTLLVKSCLAAPLAVILASGPALAHAADQGFVLLLPTTAYIVGGTLTVAATILLLILLRPGQLDPLMRPVVLGPPRAKRDWRGWGQLFAAIGLALLILIGLRGPTDPQANLMPLVLWTVWWMLLFVVQALVFDIWSWINPWPALLRVLVPESKALITLPAGLSIWPAVVIMAAFQGFVLADAAPNDPERLAIFAIGYWVFTLAGMTVFGRETWLRQVECFTVLFTLIGLLRPVKRSSIGFPGWQVFSKHQLDLSHAGFILIVLASGSFDGLYETFRWLARIGVNPLEYPGRTALVWPTTLGLYGSILFLTAIFALAVFLGTALVKGSVGFKTAFVRFSFTLLPIAIGYHFAHYFVTFLVQIQVVLATLADPFALGWNLFGLGHRRVMVGFLTVPGTVKAIWLCQAGAVVLSHVLAVLLSHRTAETFCSSRRDILALQSGISILMVFYTIFGLWLLASPRGA